MAVGEGGGDWRGEGKGVVELVRLRPSSSGDRISTTPVCVLPLRWSHHRIGSESFRSLNSSGQMSRMRRLEPVGVGANGQHQTKRVNLVWTWCWFLPKVLKFSSGKGLTSTVARIVGPLSVTVVLNVWGRKIVVPTVQTANVRTANRSLRSTGG